MCDRVQPLVCGTVGCGRTLSTEEAAAQRVRIEELGHPVAAGLPAGPGIAGMPPELTRTRIGPAMTFRCIAGRHAAADPGRS